MNDSEIDELPPVPAAQLLAMIDSEQDQLLLDLDSLNARLEAVLRESAPTVDTVETTIPLRKAA